ncbi:uncharacterized protein LOC144433994 [Glandiceps talaboti]
MTSSTVCVFIMVLVGLASTIDLNDFEYKELEDDMDTLPCFGCEIHWDELSVEYVQCEAVPRCPEALGKLIRESHGPDVKTVNLTWYFAAAKPDENGKVFRIGLPDFYMDKDLDMGTGKGDEIIGFCSKCKGIYVNYGDEYNMYNFCEILEVCPKEFTGSFSWTPFRKEIGDLKMLCTNLELTEKYSHGHCFLPWNKTPVIFPDDASGKEEL